MASALVIENAVQAFTKGTEISYSLTGIVSGESRLLREFQADARALSSAVSCIGAPDDAGVTTFRARPLAVDVPSWNRRRYHRGRQLSSF